MSFPPLHDGYDLSSVDVDKLSVATVDVKPEWFDWGHGLNVDGVGDEGWTYYEAEEVEVDYSDVRPPLLCEECGGDVELDGDGWRHPFAADQADHEVTLEELEEGTDVFARSVRDGQLYEVVVGSGFVSDSAGGEHLLEGPMTNYRYPLETFRADPRAAAAALLHTSLVLVHDLSTDLWYLALAGVGMDFSWEICEAYVRLGYLPPLHFCDLPRMAGDHGRPNELKVIEACQRSAEVAAQWAQGTAARLDLLRASLFDRATA